MASTLPALTSWPYTQLGKHKHKAHKPAPGSLLEPEPESGRRAANRFRYRGANLAGFIELDDDTMTPHMLHDHLQRVPDIERAYWHDKGWDIRVENACNKTYL